MIHTAVKSKTATHDIVDRELKDAGEPKLSTIVRQGRKAGTSWRLIAVDVNDRIGRNVNWQTIRNWFPEID